MPSNNPEKRKAPEPGYDDTAESVSSAEQPPLPPTPETEGPEAQDFNYPSPERQKEIFRAVIEDRQTKEARAAEKAGKSINDAMQFEGSPSAEVDEGYRLPPRERRREIIKEVVASHREKRRLAEERMREIEDDGKGTNPLKED